MKPFKLTLLLALLALLLGALPLTHIQAQDGDGLSDEEQAALERALAALDGLADYESYVMEESASGESVLSGTLQAQQIDQIERLEREGRSTFVLLDGEPNVQMVTQVNVAGEEAFSYEAELRLVDGTFYADVTVLEDEDGALELPEGWFELEEDTAPWYSLADLEPENFLEQGRPFTLEVNEITDDSEFVSRVEVASEALEDGTALDLITIYFDPEGVANLFGADESEDDPMTQMMMDSATEESFLEMTIALDEDEQVRRIHVNGRLDTSEMDVSTVDESVAEGEFVFSFKLVYDYRYTFSEINAELSPVEAPELE